MQCGFDGQAMIATTKISPVPGKEYLKIACPPVDEVAQVAR